MARSITVFAEHAKEIAQNLGGVINGTAWIDLQGRNVVLVTVLDCARSLQRHPAFKKAKANKQLASWARA